jgi:inosine-uridine nucleoside N-ribohydrolase
LYNGSYYINQENFAMAQKQKIILDVDTGYDDAIAILLAGHHPALELVAVTVTHGNAPLAVTLDNTLRVMEAGRLAHVPVLAGAAQALVADPAPTGPQQQAILPLPAPTIAARPQHAVNFLLEHYLGPAGPETIYAPVGPQTNLALALRLEPRLAARIPRIVTMGGAYLEGNTTPSAEFNILADPEAAHIVFSAGIPLTMVGLEVTAQGLITFADVERLRALNTPWAQAAAGLIALQIRPWVERRGWAGGQVYDACAVAAVIEPDILQTKPMHVAIELRGQLTSGRTVADISGQHGRPANVAVGVSIDRERLSQILVEGLA